MRYFVTKKGSKSEKKKRVVCDARTAKPFVCVANTLLSEICRLLSINIEISPKIGPDNLLVEAQPTIVLLGIP